MLQRLKNLIKRYGISRISMDLGYRSNSTVYKWINENRIPDIARTKVKNYLAGVK